MKRSSVPRTGESSRIAAAARRVPAAVVVTLTLATACAHAPSAPRPARTLSPDSLALLHEALPHVRPAFPTQVEALRAGVYREEAATAAAHPPQPDPAVRAGLIESAAAGSGFVIQIAAYADRALAERAAAEAQRRFPHTLSIVEAVGELYRVGLVGWESAPAAMADLPAIRRVYPGAWVRRRGVS